MYRLPPQKSIATRETLEDLLEPWPMNWQNANCNEIRIPDMGHPGLLDQLEEVIQGTDVGSQRPNESSAWEQAVETLALRSLPQSAIQPLEILDRSALEQISEPGPDWATLPSQLSVFERMEAMKDRLEVEFDRKDLTSYLRSSGCRPLSDVKNADDLIFKRTVHESPNDLVREDPRCKDKRKLVYPPIPDQLPVPYQWRPPPKLLPLSKTSPKIKNDPGEEEEQ